MSPIPSISATFCQAIVAVGMAALAAAALGAAARSPAMRELCAKFRRMSRIGQAVVLAAVICLVAYSGTKPSGAPQLRGGITPPSTNTFSAIEQQTGYALSSIGTNETHDFTMPEGALLAERIARRGAHDDGFWFHDAFTNRLGGEGLALENSAWVHTDGTVSYPRRVGWFSLEGFTTNAAHSNTVVYAPLQGSYGFLPASRWPSLGVSRIWTAVSDQDSRVVTWEGALLDRDPAYPVSFQAEFFANGDIAYRYGNFPTNGVTAGVWRNGAPQLFTPPPSCAPSTFFLSYVGDLGDGTGDADADGLTDWEEVMAYRTDPRESDTDGDGLSDGAETSMGTDPRDPDEDGDGIADGTTLAELAASPLIAGDAGSAGLLFSFSAARASAMGVLVLDGLHILVTNGTIVAVSLPTDAGVPFRFVATGRIAASVAATGNGLSILADDPVGFLAGRPRMAAHGRLLAATGMDIVCVNPSIAGSCVHEYPGTRRYRVELGNGEWDYWKKYAVITGENADIRSLTLHVADTAPSSASLDISFPPSVMLSGSLSASVGIHRCFIPAWGDGDCIVCGDHPWHSHGLSVYPSRVCLGAGTSESATVTVPADSYVQNPTWSLAPQTADGPTLEYGGSSTTVRPGTATGVYTLTATGEGCSVEATVIVYAVDYLAITSSAFPSGQETVRFPGMVPHPFNPSRMISAEDPEPDLHQPFFYKDIQSGFAVPPFTVDLTAHFEPDCIGDGDVACEWRMVSPGEAGTLSDGDKIAARFSPATDGGVYRFVFSCGALSNSEANLVLPLAGSSVDAVMLRAVARTDVFCDVANTNYSWGRRNSMKFGKKWFVNDGNGDFRGRPDNNSLPNKTVRYYNQVNDDTGLGAVATWYGCPIRVAKLSNFIVGYACEKLDVRSWRMRLSQGIGTGNDGSAQASWDAGVAVARGSNYLQTVSCLVTSIWDKADIKTMRLWPNPSSTDNFRPFFLSPNELFTTPGFVEATP